MACCLTAPGHYLTQCWLNIRGRFPSQRVSNMEHWCFLFSCGSNFENIFSHSLNKQSSGLDIGCELAQKWTLQNLTNEQSTLVQAMHWYRQAQTISWAKLCNVNHNANIVMFYILSRQITHFQLHSRLALVRKDQCISAQLFQLSTLIPIK